MPWNIKYEGKYVDSETTAVRDLHNDLEQAYPGNFKSVTSYFPPAYKVETPSYIEIEFETEPPDLSQCEDLIDQHGLNQESS